MLANSNEIFTLWVGPPNELMILCIRSWLKLGYKLKLYCDDLNEDKLQYIFRKDKENIAFLNYNIVKLNSDITNIQAQSDLWRFEYLYKFGGTWLDADMFLLKRLPEKEIIISSEHTCQKGAYKTLNRTSVPNIGVLRFPPNHELMKLSVNQKINWHSTSKLNCLMLKYQKILRANNHWMNFVVEPNVFCPVSWSNVKELYYSNQIPDNKYGIKQLTKNEILAESIGVHLWNNFTYNKHKIEFSKVNPASLFRKLQEYPNHTVIPDAQPLKKEKKQVTIEF